MYNLDKAIEALNTSGISGGEFAHAVILACENENFISIYNKIPEDIRPTIIRIIKRIKAKDPSSKFGQCLTRIQSKLRNQ